jgi:hypothetical protein
MSAKIPISLSKKMLIADLAHSFTFYLQLSDINLTLPQ